MKDKLRKLYNTLFFAGIAEKDFARTGPQVDRDNKRMLRALSITACILFTLCLAFCPLFPSVRGNTLCYFIFFVLFWALRICETRLSETNHTLIILCCYLFDLLLLAFGMVLTLVFSPARVAVSLIAVIVIIPLLFTDKPVNAFLLTFTANIVFLILAYFLKPRDVFEIDAMDICLFAFVGQVVNLFMTRVKYERYLYALDAESKAATSRNASLTDALTGLKNRRAFNDDIYAGTLSEDHCVVMLDMNGLKNVNDSHGHTSGDALVISAANCIRDAFGPYGTCYRIGGDEFCALLNAPEETVMNAAKRLENACERFNRLSISYGIASHVSDPEADLPQLMNIADGRMYQYKADYYKRSSDAGRLRLF